MKLVPILPDFASKLQAKVRKISKELVYNIVMERVRPNSLILLGNGDPDDQIMAILCHHLDGEKEVAIVKSKLTRVDALRNLSIYLEKLRSITTVIEVLDQENDYLDTIFENVEAILRNKNIRYRSKHEFNRIKEYECVSGSRRFDLIVVVSGLDNPDSIKHNIEEHLLVAAIKLGVNLVLDDKIDPKNVWRSLPYEKRLGVLKQLLNQKSFAKKTFLSIGRVWN